MSIFNENPATENQEVEGNATETATTETQESYVARLAKERGEKWSDPEVIAKGKIEADGYIKQLEAQLEELRTDLGKQDYAAQLLNQLQGKAPESTTEPVVSNNASGTGQENTTPEISEDVLKSLVEKTLTDREAANTKQQNIDLVTQQMTEKYGTEASARIQSKAEELGLSAARMEELAAESPSAFLTLIGEPPAKAATMTRGSINTAGVGNVGGGDRDFAYYQKLRRENRSQYYTPKVQQQMMEDRMRLGDRFGG